MSSSKQPSIRSQFGRNRRASRLRARGSIAKDVEESLEKKTRSGREIDIGSLADSFVEGWGEDEADMKRVASQRSFASLQKQQEEEEKALRAASQPAPSGGHEKKFGAMMEKVYNVDETNHGDPITNFIFSTSVETDNKFTVPSSLRVAATIAKISQLVNGDVYIKELKNVVSKGNPEQQKAFLNKRPGYTLYADAGPVKESWYWWYHKRKLIRSMPAGPNRAAALRVLENMKPSGLKNYASLIQEYAALAADVRAGLVRKWNQKEYVDLFTAIMHNDTLLIDGEEVNMRQRMGVRGQTLEDLHALDAVKQAPMKMYLRKGIVINTDYNMASSTPIKQYSYVKHKETGSLIAFNVGAPVYKTRDRKIGSWKLNDDTKVKSFSNPYLQLFVEGTINKAIIQTTTGFIPLDEDYIAKLGYLTLDRIRNTMLTNSTPMGLLSRLRKGLYTYKTGEKARSKTVRSNHPSLREFNPQEAPPGCHLSPVTIWDGKEYSTFNMILPDVKPVYNQDKEATISHDCIRSISMCRALFPRSLTEEAFTRIGENNDNDFIKTLFSGITVDNFDAERWVSELISARNASNPEVSLFRFTPENTTARNGPPYYEQDKKGNIKLDLPGISTKFFKAIARKGWAKVYKDPQFPVPSTAFSKTELTDTVELSLKPTSVKGVVYDNVTRNATGMDARAVYSPPPLVNYVMSKMIGVLIKDKPILGVHTTPLELYAGPRAIRHTNVLNMARIAIAEKAGPFIRWGFNCVNPLTGRLMRGDTFKRAAAYYSDNCYWTGRSYAPDPSKIFAGVVSAKPPALDADPKEFHDLKRESLDDLLNKGYMQNKYDLSDDAYNEILMRLAKSSTGMLIPIDVVESEAGKIENDRYYVREVLTEVEKYGKYKLQKMDVMIPKDIRDDKGEPIPISWMASVDGRKMEYTIPYESIQLVVYYLVIRAGMKPEVYKKLFQDAFMCAMSGGHRDSRVLFDSFLTKIPGQKSGQVLTVYLNSLISSVYCHIWTDENAKERNLADTFAVIEKLGGKFTLERFVMNVNDAKKKDGHWVRTPGLPPIITPGRELGADLLGLSVMSTVLDVHTLMEADRQRRNYHIDEKIEDFSPNNHEPNCYCSHCIRLISSNLLMVPKLEEKRAVDALISNKSERKRPLKKRFANKMDVYRRILTRLQKEENAANTCKIISLAITAGSDRRFLAVLRTLAQELHRHGKWSSDLSMITNNQVPGLEIFVEETAIASMLKAGPEGITLENVLSFSLPSVVDRDEGRTIRDRKSNLPVVGFLDAEDLKIIANLDATEEVKMKLEYQDFYRAMTFQGKPEIKLTARKNVRTFRDYAVSSNAYSAALTRIRDYEMETNLSYYYTKDEVKNYLRTIAFNKWKQDELSSLVVPRTGNSPVFLSPAELEKKKNLEKRKAMIDAVRTAEAAHQRRAEVASARQERKAMKKALKLERAAASKVSSRVPAPMPTSRRPKVTKAVYVKLAGGKVRLRPFEGTPNLSPYVKSIGDAIAGDYLKLLKTVDLEKLKPDAEVKLSRLPVDHKYSSHSHHLLRALRAPEEDEYVLRDGVYSFKRGKGDFDYRVRLLVVRQLSMRPSSFSLYTSRGKFAVSKDVVNMADVKSYLFK